MFWNIAKDSPTYLQLGFRKLVSFIIHTGYISGHKLFPCENLICSLYRFAICLTGNMATNSY